MKKSLINKQYGLSLVELMIAITLGLVLMTGMVQMFAGSRTTFVTQQSISRVQETGRLAMEFLSQDIRMAGFAGCASRATGSNVASFVNSTNYLYSFDAVKGVNAGSPATVPNGSGIDQTPLDGTDILGLSVVPNSVPDSIVSKENSADKVFVTLTSTVADGCGEGVTKYNGFCPGDILVISDCQSVRIFQATGFSVSGSELSIKHEDTGSPGNKVENWTIADPAELFEEGALVQKLSKITYFVANSNVTGRPSLWQSVDGQDTELLEGVEDIALSYGVDTVANNQAIADTYKSASAVTAANQWNSVLSVRINLLVSSSDDNVLEESKPITFNGVDKDITDRRMRQIFVGTVGIRNRMQ